jgi:BTB/POZ domain
VGYIPLQVYLNAKATKQGDKLIIGAFMSNCNFLSSETRYLKDDCFMLKCVVKLVRQCFYDERKKTVLVPASNFYQSDIYHHSIHPYNERSPIFRLLFFSLMIKGKTDCIIKVEDMKPEVFKLMLHFVYTDSLPHQHNCQEVGFGQAA